MLNQVLNARYFIWGLLVLPSIPMLLTLVSGAVGPTGKPATEFLLHPTGETSARLMIIAMILTPLRLLFPGSSFLRWMIKRRRYFGVAAFAYALFHLVLYLIDMGSLRTTLGEAFAIGIWTGWLAFVVFVPLALTSNDASVRALGPAWKKVQRLVYASAILTLLHWIYVHNNLGLALVHFAPLAALEAYRIWKLTRRHPSVAKTQKETPT